MSKVPVEALDGAQSVIEQQAAEIERLRDRLCRAFLEGAKWWEYRTTEATMGSADQHAAMDEAEARLARGTLGASEKEFLATLEKGGGTPT